MINLLSVVSLALCSVLPSVSAPRESYGANLNVYPDYVNIVPNDVAIQNSNYVGIVDVSPDNNDVLEFGYCYQLSYASLTWQNTVLTEVRSVSFIKYSLGNVSNLNAPFPNFYAPTYTLYTPSTNYYYCRNYLGVRLDFLRFAKANNSSSSYGVDQYNTLYPYYETLYQPTTSGPYYMGVDFASSQLFSYITSLVASLNGNSQTINGNAYNNGYNDGKSAGYNQGYADGQSSVTEEGLIVSNLFGAVFGVPIGILNGLAPLAIWNIPIISIAFTFLFFSLILWLIKRFI